MTSDNSPSRKLRAAIHRIGLLAVAAIAFVPVPAEAGWRLDYAPAVDLERLDVDLIRRAKTSIDMAAYLLTDVELMDALAEAGKRGVRIRIYFEPSSPLPCCVVAEAFARLYRTPNVIERTKIHGALMHLKSYLVDGQVLRGGAANFSASGLKRQDNDRYETDDPAAVDAFRRAFNSAWDR